MTSIIHDWHHIWRTLTLYDHHHHLLSNSNSDQYTLLSGPTLASKPLQEHELIIMMELHHCWLSSTLFFIFQIKIYNRKIETFHAKMELLEPNGKVWYRPEKIATFFDENPNWMAPLRIDTWPKCCPLTDLRLPPLQHLGHLSLQIYLLHDPVLRIALTYLPMVSQSHYWIILWAYSPPDLLMIPTCNKITPVLNYNIT